MTEQNQNAMNDEQFDEYMYRKYEGNIKDGSLQIDNQIEVTNLRFIEKFDIQTLELQISSGMNVKLRSNTLTKLFVSNYRDEDEEQQQRLNMQVDDLELENLEILILQENKLKNEQLYNLAKFKKLHILNVSWNNVDLTNIHSVTSLTRLLMESCGLKNIDLISSLVNLKELDLSQNKGIKDIFSPLCKLNSLTTLTMQDCGLQNIDKISSLVNLEELDLSLNEDMDLNPLYQVRSLTKLSMRECGLTNIDQIALLINLKVLNLASNQLLNQFNRLIGKPQRAKYQLQ
ncbi:leucine-rich_repeat domain-containing protein [Hexamita inflata]|uniref:Leucine-rich repeat domain-containing protein n=1 Tax=Hexamita inflata TaxID=28002 RepID=A0AA86QD75_9EUKA|nr:leucine-rich repeat domain-containing protein [Hexamita inflata]